MLVFIRLRAIVKFNPLAGGCVVSYGRTISKFS